MAGTFQAKTTFPEGRILSRRATSRLRQVVAAGGLHFKGVPCACPAGTEGTQQCNHGRLCGYSARPVRDVGQVLINEGLSGGIRLWRDGW